ncbi:DUF1801 domain-containing protein [Plantactinospora endophytica]|uniref:YdhG-like domain-containing protein n=1 Tax=Plantactinospora endophytica TaxID=673535 RepID=A0ABQ4DX11_9ACTN|nr:DUF1801 domain-containing protein [Plantactinospora endophytica]GIG87013.1 hypothetical protein Pen02_19490 [Plantactinospora endophytica]
MTGPTSEPTSGPDLDAYVRSTYSAAHQAIIGVLRDLMAETAPGIREVVYNGSLAWRGDRIVAIISPSKTHLTFAFARGAEFTDGYGLLAGVGRTTRHVKLKNPDAVPQDALRDYIRQAVGLDGR